MVSYIADFELYSSTLAKPLLRFKPSREEISKLLKFSALGKAVKCENGER
jgi:hypothetical protein